MTQPETFQVGKKLTYLRTARPDVFGADFHGFRMSPTLSNDEVIAFEGKHSIQLPKDFREFITLIGNGGAGPFYGVFPLGVVDDNDDFREWHEGDDLVGAPSKPFDLKKNGTIFRQCPPMSYSVAMRQNTGAGWRPSREFIGAPNW